MKEQKISIKKLASQRHAIWEVMCYLWEWITPRNTGPKMSEHCKTQKYNIWSFQSLLKYTINPFLPQTNDQLNLSSDMWPIQSLLRKVSEFIQCRTVLCYHSDAFRIIPVYIVICLFWSPILRRSLLNSDKKGSCLSLSLESRTEITCKIINAS